MTSFANPVIARPLGSWFSTTLASVSSLPLMRNEHLPVVSVIPRDRKWKDREDIKAGQTGRGGGGYLIGKGRTRHAISV